MLVKFNLKMLYVNTFVKVDTQIEEDCRQTISYLKGYSYLRLYCKKQSNQKLTANTVSTLRRTILSWVRSDIRELLYSSNLLCIWPSLLDTNLNIEQNIASTKNCQEFLASQVPVLKRNKATNASSSNHPFSAVMNPSYLVIYSSFLDLPSHSHGKFTAWE